MLNFGFRKKKASNLSLDEHISRLKFRSFILEAGFFFDLVLDKATLKAVVIHCAKINDIPLIAAYVLVMSARVRKSIVEQDEIQFGLSEEYDGEETLFEFLNKKETFREFLDRKINELF